jgi:hypothetical protein
MAAPCFANDDKWDSSERNAARGAASVVDVGDVGVGAGTASTASTALNNAAG